MKKKKLKSKNYAHDGPEGQSRRVGAAMCNAGLPTWNPRFLSLRSPDKVSMKKKKRRKDSKIRAEGRSIYVFQKAVGHDTNQ